MRHHIGKFRLGYKFVELYIHDDDDGGTLYVCGPNDNNEISIGCKGFNDQNTQGVLLHEAIEMEMVDQGLGYIVLGAYNNQTPDCRSFLMNHQQYQEVIDRVGYFIKNSHEAFWKKYEQLKREQRCANRRPSRSKRAVEDYCI